MRYPFRGLRHTTMAAAGAFLMGCATTTVTITPSPQAPICDGAASALILWAPQWRPDQKDVPEREAAADAGLQEFLQRSGCFPRFKLRRLLNMNSSAVAGEFALAHGQFDKVVTITVRELGPLIKLLASLALIDGGTEVVLQVSEYIPPGDIETRSFTVHWQNGGPGVIKSTASLQQDMQDALVLGLQPIATQK